MRFIGRATSLAVTFALLAVTSVSAAGLGIKNGKVAVTSPDGMSDATYK